MSAKDISELLSQYKNPDMLSIQRYAAVYVNASGVKEVTIPPSKFLTLEKGELEKYAEFFKTVLKPKKFGDAILIAKVDYPAEFQMAIDEEMKENTVIDDICDTIMRGYSRPGCYTIHLFYSVYDIPDKNDGDSEYAFRHILGIITPATVEDPELEVYWKIRSDGSKEGGFRMKDQRTTIGTPDTAFIYPALVNHMEDRTQMYWYNADPLDMETELMHKWCIDIPIPASGYMDMLENDIHSVYGDKAQTKKMMNAFAYRICTLFEDGDCPETISPEYAQKVLENCGCTDLMRIREMLEQQWIENPRPEQLYKTDMVRKHSAEIYHNGLLKTLERTRLYADMQGNKDLADEIEELIGKEKMKA